MAEIQSRVVDYLDDQIQTPADLDRINALLARVEEQQTILQKQLAEAQTARLEAENDAKSQSDTLEQHIADFQRQQDIIDQELKTITNSNTSNDAVKKIESRMSKVQRLEIAAGYLEIVQEVEQLSSSSRETLRSDPRSALRTYSRLQTLSNALKQAQPEAEGAAPHLIDQVESVANSVREQLQSGLVSDFKGTLEKMKWPQRELNLIGGLTSTWTQQAELLLELQEPQLLSKKISASEDPNIEPTILLPLDIMVQPLAQRFRYHFYGERPTNRLDKPEYFLSHIFELLDRHSPFVTEALQPVLDQRIQTLDELEHVYPDAVSSFITALLPLVMTKSLSILPQISSHPQLFSHFIHELMAFDNTLRDSWGYVPLPGTFIDWKGVTWSILVTKDYFDTWLNVEKQFALSRYKAIRDAEDATEIDYEGVAPSQTKPTKGTIRVNDLLETITDRYRPLSSFSQKMRFLIDIQLSMFDDYHNYLHAAFQAYLASSHTAGRLLQGQSKSEALGQKGLVSLCKIYGSAAFLERKMSDWSDDVFFLELWEELQDRARTNSTSANGSLGRDLHVDDVAAKTSAAIKQNGSTAFQDADGGGLFDETALAYSRLKEQSESEILRLLDANIHDAVVPLSQLESWASLSAPATDASELSPSPALDSILQAVALLLGFLVKVLAPAPMRKMVKHFCSTLQSDLYDTVLLRHTFSALGVAQMKRDVIAIEHAVDSTCRTRGVAATSMRKFKQALVLVGLPVKASAPRHIHSQTSIGNGDEDDGDDWGFNEDGDNNNINNTSSNPQGVVSSPPTDADSQSPSRAAAAVDQFPSNTNDDWSLWAAERQIFQSNEAARQALADMGLDLLSESEARNVLKRRVEISS